MTNKKSDLIGVEKAGEKAEKYFKLILECSACNDYKTYYETVRKIAELAVKELSEVVN